MGPRPFKRQARIQLDGGLHGVVVNVDDALSLRHAAPCFAAELGARHFDCSECFERAGKFLIDDPRSIR